MPRKPIEWSKCIIYKIWKDDEFYVGSTTDLASRKRQHKNACNCITHKDHNCKVYQTIREKGGWVAWEMTPLEEYKECQTQIEARIREEEWRVKLNANLNSRKCFADSLTKEYMIQYNKERKEELKQYRQEHKEEIKEYNKQYAQDNANKLKEKFECKCGGKYTYKKKTQHEKTIKHQTYLATI